MRNRLADGLQENLTLLQAKAVVALDSLARESDTADDAADPDTCFRTPLETAVDFGTRYRADGWAAGLTTLSYVADLYPDVGGRDRRRAMFAGVRAVADDAAGEPPRFQQYAFANRRLSKDRLKSWFRETCEVRDADGAERCLLTAVGALPSAEVVEILVAAATHHLYLNASHPLDFLNSAIAAPASTVP